MEEDRPHSRGRELALNGAHLLGLSGLAFAEPLYDLLRSDLSSLVAADATGGALVLLILGIALVPPFVLLAIEAVAYAIRPGIGRVLHLVFVGGLIALFVCQSHASLDVPDWLLIVAAPLLGVAGALLVRASGPVRFGLTLLSPAPLVFAAVFLISPAVAPLLSPDEPDVQANAAPAGRPPVVLVVFDELPVTSLLDAGGRIDAGRYPAFARLARDGTWFANTTSVDGATPWAVPAILTGDYPDHDALPTSTAHPHSIFTLLGAGREVHELEPITRVCPASVCHGEDRGAPSRALHAANLLTNASANRLLPDPMGRGALKVVRSAQRLVGLGTSGDYLASAVRLRRDGLTSVINSIHSGDRPGLYVVHALLPHGPWELLPSGRRYTQGVPGLANGRWTSDPVPVAEGWQRHLLQLEYTDRVLGRLLDRLREQGLYDKSLVAVVADHGVNFAPGQLRRGIDERSVRQLAPVPFILKAPGRHRGGRIETEPLQTVDVLPTIADALDVNPTWHSDGTSAFGPERSRAGTARMTEGGESGVEVSRAGIGRGGPAASERQALFGSGRDQRGLYTLGDGSRLVGRHAPEGWRRVQASGLRDADAGYVDGRLRDVPAGRELAVVVGGRVAAVTRGYAAGGRTAFGAPLPEWAVRRGGRVAVLALSSR